jgi:hypothetical protein
LASDHRPRDEHAEESSAVAEESGGGEGGDGTRVHRKEQGDFYRRQLSSQEPSHRWTATCRWMDTLPYREKEGREMASLS